MLLSEEESVETTFFQYKRNAKIKSNRDKDQAEGGNRVRIFSCFVHKKGNISFIIPRVLNVFCINSSFNVKVPNKAEKILLPLKENLQETKMI